jgi:ketosteroid isomerase-like protein
VNEAERRRANQDRIRELFSNLYEWASQGELDRIRAYYTEDTVLEMPQLGMRTEGLDAVMEGVKSVPTNFSRWSHKTFEFHEMLDPDEVVWEADADAVFRHSGAPYEQRYVLFTRLQDGKISFYREYVNTQELSKFPQQAS